MKPRAHGSSRVGLRSGPWMPWAGWLRGTPARWAFPSCSSHVLKIQKRTRRKSSRTQRPLLPLLCPQDTGSPSDTFLLRKCNVLTAPQPGGFSLELSFPYGSPWQWCLPSVLPFCSFSGPAKSLPPGSPFSAVRATLLSETKRHSDTPQSQCDGEV